MSECSTGDGEISFWKELGGFLYMISPIVVGCFLGWLLFGRA